MKILHVIPSLSGGGAERQLEYLSGELVARGHEVTVAYGSPGTLPWSSAEVQLVRIGSGGSSWNPRLLLRTVGLVRRIRPDVIQSWILQMDVVAGITSLLTGTPWILREPTTGVFYRTGLRPRLRLAVARARAAAVVANSQGGLDYWAAHAPALSRRLLPNGVPLEQIDAVRSLPREREFGLFVGRLETMKNVDVALEAARRTGTPFVVCGDGPDRGRLESTGVPDVTFTGYSTEVWATMKSASFVVSLSDFEGRPNTVLEAFAARVPVILSEIPAHHEVADDSSAWFVPLRDVDAVAATIREILAGGESVAARVNEARRRVEEFSIRRMADAYEDLYRGIVAGVS